MFEKKLKALSTSDIAGAESIGSALALRRDRTKKGINLAKVATLGLTCSMSAFMFTATATAQEKISDGVVKVGVLTDMSGTYSDFTGSGSVIAAKMAMEDFAKNGTVLGKKIEVISADHLNKADVGAERARQWFDREKVDVIVDLVATNVALAVMDVA